MIAKIGKGVNLYSVILYNTQKVDKENGQILLLNRLPETPDNNYSATYLLRGFDPYLAANIKTELPVRHISLNPDPKDKVADNRFVKMAEEYMKEMGYSQQPYVVFKHTDIERTHIHIVTVCIGPDGKKIPDAYDHPRSMAVCRNLEKKYGLHPAVEKQREGNKQHFRPVDYNAGNIKAQIAAVVRYLPQYYNYQSFGAYNALLSLFNITAKEVTGEHDGKPKQGMVYFALDASGQIAGNPFKASLFGKNAGYSALQAHYERSAETSKNGTAKRILKETIELAMHAANDESGFKAQLKEQGINTVTRRNTEGRIYGITFIDHTSRSVWNGSQLGKGVSANVFNQWWNEGITPQLEDSGKAPVPKQHVDPEWNGTHGLFGFLDNKAAGHTATDESLIEALSGILPSGQGEDYDELAFANRMKERKRRNNK